MNDFTNAGIFNINAGLFNFNVIFKIIPLAPAHNQKILSLGPTQ